MEHLYARVGEPFTEATGAPTLFYVGTWDGVAHLIRFGPDDQIYDVKREADRLRRVWRKGKTFDKRL